LFCRHANPEDLAEKILELKNNPPLRQKIAEGGYHLFLEQCTPKIIVKKLLADLDRLFLEKK
jgi:glycosyltransferase involved in cell wall biosynthesis